MSGWKNGGWTKLATPKFVLLLIRKQRGKIKINVNENLKKYFSLNQIENISAHFSLRMSKDRLLQTRGGALPLKITEIWELFSRNSKMLVAILKMRIVKK